MTALLFMALSVLGGCSSGATTSPTRQSPQALALAQDAMARGPMLVVIQGNPYTMPDDAFAARVLDDMRTAMTWAATPRLTSDPVTATTPSLRVVMTFNAGVIKADVQCLGGSGGGRLMEQGAVQVTASFCSNGVSLSGTSGGIDRSSGIDDAEFVSLISQVTDDLFTRPPSRFPELGIGVGGSVGVGSGGFSSGGVGVGVGF